MMTAVMIAVMIAMMIATVPEMMDIPMPPAAIWTHAARNLMIGVGETIEAIEETSETIDSSGTIAPSETTMLTGTTTTCTMMALDATTIVDAMDLVDPVIRTSLSAEMMAEAATIVMTKDRDTVREARLATQYAMPEDRRILSCWKVFLAPSMQ